MGHSGARPADFAAPDPGFPGTRAPFDPIAKARPRAALGLADEPTGAEPVEHRGAQPV